ncbi:MAG: hypothetical protein SAJ12_10460 [Jaaginema sp. PMC 1079.18]|nr:hypothetical protein [Jaaginema sp. PMC 1080.18]MEC4851423.1 hypothetical protein [Jaaginema sp. PMC 1079.18]MEC4866106.1 hypothetical protein [Jaaginema sp. PMC 1078.18]
MPKTDPNHPSLPFYQTNGAIPGITKREYIATQLMSAWISTGSFDPNDPELAVVAVNAADNLIEQLNDEQ